MREVRHALAAGLALLTAGAVLLAQTPVAQACGCLSPPAVTEGQYAVNQSAEQIIFETEPGWVTAHVLIKYAGDPAKFAWIIPVPEVPELAISPVSAFGLLDKLTAPDISVSSENICPISEWTCQYNDPVYCGGFGGADDLGEGGGSGAGASADAGAGAPGDPVTVINEQVVGDYQTVTFRASEAAAATQWLRDNGFIVNQTTSIYMESYVQANMVFVAAKLIPGAGVKAIKPLKMRYRAAYPMVPLILTAVAAEPHLTVTTFIYGDRPFRPLGHPVVEINPERIARDSANRSNYPQVLARTIDEAGGDAFAIEYRGSPLASNLGNSFCCQNSYDSCNVGNNGQCECPGSTLDEADCSKQGDLNDGVKLLDELATKYTALTRITTRVSPEEMTFDPQYEPDFAAQFTGRLTARGTQPSLSGCTTQVIDQKQLAKIDALQRCAATYCGAGGRCGTTQFSSGCECAPGFVSQRFTDLDGQPSVTCIPETPPVDLRAGGFQLPDACAGVNCGMGSCVDRNGVATCKCNEGTVAVAGNGTVPHCDPIQFATYTQGAQDYSEALRGLAVCAPAYPSCGEDGWLVKQKSPRPGVACGNVNDPPPWLTTPKPQKTCGAFGCGGCETSGGGPLSIGIAWVVLLLVLRPRRRRAKAD
ncbi:MAG TPA: DUF2330 domain-containing protein [Kofleriaceae bacterium]|nr:DUF2330 domain-containing protein [Kofleriaceae bacterium]